MNVESSQISDHSRFVTGYVATTSSYDEMCSADGTLRPQWEYLIRSLETLGPQELLNREQEAKRLLRENGVTYNVYNDPRGVARLWELDIVPLLVTSQEWSVIEQGLIQRAELFNLVLADLYGPRTLIAKGLLPPEVVYTHPGFLLPCVNVRQAGNCHLPLYAADLTRAPDGSMWVIGNRAQAPSGAGYALENRIVLSRMLPSLYRDSHVHRVALFFRALRATLHALAPQQRDNPRIVLLTPGPDNETYFEHSYLANYLGFMLAQGGDLTVRDGKVWLSTVDGLQPVDVILRRVDDIFCDPLELRQDSLLGTPGLLQAARLGHVSIVNPLGSGILENPALMAFLPALSRQLLGEDLRLPSVATWWCGGEKERTHVLENLDRLVIKPIFPHPSTSTIFGAALSTVERQALVERIRAQPHLFVGQEQVALSTTPVFTKNGLEPRPMVMRSFLVARDESYVVMPGGLTRVSPSLDTWIVSNQRGGISKDTWVLASEPERAVSLLSTHRRSVDVVRSGGEIPGRVADNLFWLGRYAERAESTARLLRTVLVRLVDIGEVRTDAGMPMLLRAVTHLTTTYPGFAREGADKRLTNPEAELLDVMRNEQRSGGLQFTLNALMLAARSVRDRLSDDGWRVLNGLPHTLTHVTQPDAALTGVDQVILGLAAFTGISTERMSRGSGWRFLDTGRRMERALFESGLLRALCVSVDDASSALWEALLTVTDNLVTYRRRYHSQFEAAPVIDLLMFDESTPRSIAYQFVRLQEHMAALPKKVVPPHRSTEERLVLEGLTALRLMDIDRLLLVPEGKEEREELEQLLSRLSFLLHALSEAMTNTYFRQTDLPHQLVDIQ
ncbi:MAG: circularly permuted type 2 ATP-grasp protein [Candidatus Binatia bacterium]